MGRKIFISYKYADSNVAALNGYWNTTVRTYVDKLESYFDNTNHIYKGESDDEDLSQFTDDQIWEKLKDRIFDSSITIVMISPGMKESHKYDKSQWIPWEISFSLRETTRNDTTSHTNALLAIVLPDSNGSYDYFIRHNGCCGNPCRTLLTNSLFKILQDNMFNVKNPNTKNCIQGSTVYYGESSYIKSVKWIDFISLPDYYIECAEKIKDNIDNYSIYKTV
jgi:hypothetical protein